MVKDYARNPIRPRSWIAWQLAKLSHHIDPAAHWTEAVEVIDKHRGETVCTIFIAANAYGGGITSASTAHQIADTGILVRSRDETETAIGEWVEW